MKTYYHWLTCAVLAAPLVSRGQELNFSQAAYNLFLVNPAFAGTENNTQATVNYRKNWLSFPGSPEKTSLAIESALPTKKTGAGLLLRKESAGIFSSSGFGLVFRHSVSITSRSLLDFGLSGGFKTLNGNFSQVQAEHMEEFGSWAQYQKSVSPSFGAGIAFRSAGFHVGLGVADLLSTQFRFKDPGTGNEISMVKYPDYVLTIRNEFCSRRKKWSYTPVLLLRSLQGHGIEPELLNTVSFRESILAGVGYRHLSAAYLTLGFSPMRAIRVIYSYERPLRNPTIAGGSHEIGLRFILTERNTKTELSDESETAELYEKLELQEDMLRKMKARTDSAEKNIALLRSDMEDLRNKQVSDEDIDLALEEWNRESSIEHRRLGNDHAAIEKQTSAQYQIVLGVYQLPGNAREYQKFLLRTLQLETELAQINGQVKKYLYVCLKKHFTEPKEALLELNRTIKLIRTYSGTVTKGEPWILQTIRK